MSASFMKKIKRKKNVFYIYEVDCILSVCLFFIFNAKMVFLDTVTDGYVSEDS